LEFGNGTKTGLPKLPVVWVTGQARQALLTVI
jgi:hypothetical protein